MASKGTVDFVVELGWGPEGTFEVQTAWGDTSVREALVVDVEAAERGLRAGVAAHLRAAREVGAPAATMEPFQASKLGAKLFEALFVKSVRSLFGASLFEAKRLEQEWRLCLKVEAAPLARVPWELLYDESARRFLAMDHALIRLPATGVQAARAVAARERRILWVGASPSDLPALDLARERRLLDEALAKVPLDVRPIVEALDPPTPEALLQRLASNELELLHFAGHGVLGDKEGALALCGPDGRTQLLSAREIGEVVARKGALGVVVLNACEGAASHAEDALSSVAALLSSQGLPAVVAMQTSIRDDFAAELTGHLYRGLAAKEPVDIALRDARASLLLMDQGGMELGAWASPALWLQWRESAPVTTTGDVTSIPVPLAVVLWGGLAVTAVAATATAVAATAREPRVEPKAVTAAAAAPIASGPPGWKRAVIAGAAVFGIGLVGAAGYYMLAGSGQAVATGSAGTSGVAADTSAGQGTTTGGQGLVAAGSGGGLPGAVAAGSDAGATAAGAAGNAPGGVPAGVAGNETGTTTGAGGSAAGDPGKDPAGNDPAGNDPAGNDDGGKGPWVNPNVISGETFVAALASRTGGVTLLMSPRDAGKDPPVAALDFTGTAPDDRATRCKGVEYCVKIPEVGYFPLPSNGLLLLGPKVPLPPWASPAGAIGPATARTTPLVWGPIATLQIYRRKPKVGSVMVPNAVVVQTSCTAKIECQKKVVHDPVPAKSFTHYVCQVEVTKMSCQ